jgi:nitrite reductase/ring-hydroxylating ferredoxin subunit
MTKHEVTRPRGDVQFADGVWLSELIDHDRREVDLRVLTDPQLYQLEIDRFFTRTWIMVGHESEVPNPGDFVLRTIGEDAVIVTRQADGEIAIMLNVCPHRGMQVCRAEYGNTKKFVCPYHGWVFGTEGRFVAAPYEPEMYGEALDHADLSLRRARVETLGGVIFGNFDPAAPSLDAFLGDLKWYLEMVLCRTDAGLEVIGPPQRALVHANWKGPAEQGSVDGYHAIGLHRSFGDLGLFGPDGRAISSLMSVDVSAAGGGLRCMPRDEAFLKAILEPATWAEAHAGDPMARLAANPPIGLTPEMTSQLANNLSSDQVKVLSSYYPSVGQAFPAFEFLLVNAPLELTKAAPMLALHTWGPKGPEHFELWTWVMVEKGAPPEMKEAARKAAIRNFGSSGNIEMDDGEAWPSQTRSARGGMGRREKFRYHAFHGHNPPPEWPGPGTIHTGITRDDGQWGWWQRYFRLMLGEE